MSKDATMESALSHWAPRMVSNGVMLTDFQEVCASIESWDGWCAAWCKRAGVHEALGLESLAEGHKLTAAELRAAAACQDWLKALPAGWTRLYEIFPSLIELRFAGGMSRLLTPKKQRGQWV